MRERESEAQDSERLSRPWLRSDRPVPRLLHHTLMVGAGYRRFVTDITRRGRMPSSFSSYLHAPARTDPSMAPSDGEYLAVLLPVPNLRARLDWESQGDRLRDALLEDLEGTFGLSGLKASVQVEHRMDPRDFARELGAVDGNAFAVEPTLQQSAWFRPANRDRALRGLYQVGGGTHPGAGIPGVLLGAEISTALVGQDFPAPRTGGRARAALPA